MTHLEPAGNDPLRHAWRRWAYPHLCWLTGELPRTPERVDPRRPSPLLSAHRALYRFATTFAPSGARVVDLGCGAGYAAGIFTPHAASYLGLDVDRATLAWARRSFGGPQACFRRLDMTRLAAAVPALLAAHGPADLVVCSNAWEHFPDAGSLLPSVRRLLAPGGRFFLAVPPSDGTPDGNHHHVSERPAAQWAEALAAVFGEVQGFSHHGWGEPEEAQEFRPAAPRELVPGATVTAVLVAGPIP